MHSYEIMSAFYNIMQFFAATNYQSYLRHYSNKIIKFFLSAQGTKTLHPMIHALIICWLLELSEQCGDNFLKCVKHGKIIFN